MSMQSGVRRGERRRGLGLFAHRVWLVFSVPTLLPLIIIVVAGFGAVEGALRAGYEQARYALEIIRSGWRGDVE